MDAPEVNAPEVSAGRARPPKRRAKFAIGGVAVFVVLLGLVVWATTRPGATSFYMSTSEVMAAGPGELDGSYRVNGKVVPGTIEQDGLLTTFTISDGTTELVVATDRPLPDTFRPRSDVIAKGHFDGEMFTADEVLAKCPSKFKARA